MLSWRLIAPLIRAMECPAAAGCMYHLKRLPASYMIAPPQPFETYTFDAPEIAIGLPSQQQRTCRFVGNGLGLASGWPLNDLRLRLIGPEWPLIASDGRARVRSSAFDCL